MSWSHCPTGSSLTVKAQPWCIGIDSGSSTGWVITDWIEDIMIRTAGLDATNAWANGDLPFSSPEVKNAFDLAGQMFFTPDYVLGGNTGILATPVVDAMDPMFTDDLQNPSCWMHKQSDWYGPDFFPDAKATGRRSSWSVRTSACSTSPSSMSPSAPRCSSPATRSWSRRIDPRSVPSPSSSRHRSRSSPG